MGFPYLYMDVLNPENVWALRQAVSGGESTQVAIDVTEMPISAILSYISLETGMDIVPVPASLYEAITITARGPWQDALAAVAEKANCTVRQIGPKRFVLERASDAD